MAIGTPSVEEILKRLGLFVPPGYDCTSDVEVGDLVYLSGANSVSKAKADTINTMPILGVVFTKYSPTRCNVADDYILKDLDPSLLPTDGVYYASVSEAGKFQNTPPTASQSILQKIGFKMDNTTLRILINETYIKRP